MYNFRNYLLIGKVIGFFGIKGECKIYPLTNTKKIFLFFKNIFYYKENIFINLKIDKIKISKKIILIKFNLVDSIEDAFKLKNEKIYIKKTTLVSISKKIDKKNYYFELEGCNVYTNKNKFIGKIDSILETKAHLIYIVKTDEKKEILIPDIPNFILKKNIRNKKIIINLIPGLVDNNEN